MLSSSFTDWEPYALFWKCSETTLQFVTCRHDRAISDSGEALWQCHHGIWTDLRGQRHSLLLRIIYWAHPRCSLAWCAEQVGTCHWRVQNDCDSPWHCNSFRPLRVHTSSNVMRQSNFLTSTWYAIEITHRKTSVLVTVDSQQFLYNSGCRSAA